jgi:protocatechuate 3,4-dioxygenase beta subunit
MKAGLLLLFLYAALHAQQGSIQGVTLNSVTHEPIPGVHVSVVAATANSVTAAYGAVSDRDGHFSIATIRPGTYLLVPERTGFLFTSKATIVPVQSITIRAGQQLTDLKLELTPRAILSGRVIDDHGDPVQDVLVNTVAVDEKDQPKLMMQPGRTATDDRGEFRIATIPGRYYVQTNNPPRNNGSNEKPEVRDGVEIAPLRSTYYPSSIEKSRATPVEAVGGKETGGIEIRLSREAGASISGIVRGMTDASNRPSVIDQWGPTAQMIRSSNSVSTDAEGRFVIRDAQAGFHRLYAVWYSKPQMASAPIEVQVGDAGVANLEITLAPTTEITGVVEAEGDPPGVDPPKRNVRLEIVNGMGMMQPYGGATDSKGGFSLSGLAASKYRVRVTPLPDNGYVKKVVVDDTESPDGTVDMSRGARPSRIKVTIGADGAQVSGHVLDEGGNRNAFSVVLLAPVPVLKEAPELVSQTQPDGTYSFKSVRPGKYRIVAIDPLRSVLGNLDESYRLLEKGEEIELKPAARLQYDVHTLKKEDADAKQ